MPTLAPAAPDLTPALDQLLAEGLLWRGREEDRRAYNTLLRWREQAAPQLHAKGWVLVHHESLQTFQAVHRKGKHHRHLSRSATLCVLALRLLRLETPAGLTQYPVISLDTLARRCADLGFQPDLSLVLPDLVTLKLIRPAGDAALRPTQPEQLLELLPTLDIAVPASAIDTLAHSLVAPQPTSPEPMA
jgi:hypothetical protein